MKLGFPKHEHLKSRKMIARLFTEGHSYMAYPLRVVWLEQDEPVDVPVYLGVSVSKRVFKTAVGRNRMKRLMREAYRLLKPELLEKLEAESHKPIAMMLLYIAKEPLSLEDVQAGIRKMIRKFPG
ncbi:MAG: ribonuclease P protein component [Lewinellaceae bacterium]|nr:ribonuclease P protein component [Lewinellaceae bacterium]